MIEPNWNIFLWAVLIVNTLLGVMYIIAGLFCAKKLKRDNYGTADIFVGFVYLAIAAAVIFL